MQIPIINGIYINASEIALQYPKNLLPIVVNSGISEGYLRQPYGIAEFSSGPGVDRGGIVWKGECYRVMGSTLIKISDSGVISELGDVGNNLLDVKMAYSFDRLAIVSDEKLWYWDGSLQQVIDGDLGRVIDVVWVDGYFVLTDGVSLIVTDLNDPFQINPLKYGSSEIDPDNVIGLLKLRNELYAFNRNTIEVFTNVGGTLFPFQRVSGAQFYKGACSRFGMCVVNDKILFVGSGYNETIGIYIGANASLVKISDDGIDKLLATYTEQELSEIKTETILDTDNLFVYIHLKDRTLVYNYSTSEITNIPIWSYLSSGSIGFSQYRARNIVYVYNKFLVGDTQSNNIGVFTKSTRTHFGNVTDFEFSTKIVYNESNGVIFNKLELVSLLSRDDYPANNEYISTSYSYDGIIWSNPSRIKIAFNNSNTWRAAWFKQGAMKKYRIQKFTGYNTYTISFVRLEADLEALQV